MRLPQLQSRSSGEYLVLSLVLVRAAPLWKRGGGSSSGALSEMVEDGKSGLLVPPREVSASAIEKPARDASLRRQTAGRGMEHVRHHFSVDASIEKIMVLYESMGS